MAIFKNNNDNTTNKSFGIQKSEITNHLFLFSTLRTRIMFGWNAKLIASLKTMNHHSNK